MCALHTMCYCTLLLFLSSYARKQYSAKQRFCGYSGASLNSSSIKDCLQPIQYSSSLSSLLLDPHFAEGTKVLNKKHLPGSPATRDSLVCDTAEPVKLLETIWKVSGHSYFYSPSAVFLFPTSWKWGMMAGVAVATLQLWGKEQDS